MTCINCAGQTTHCSVQNGIRELWKLDEYLNEHVPAVDMGSGNRFYEKGLSREMVPNKCPQYVVLNQVGTAIPVATTNQGVFHQLTFTFDFYVRTGPEGPDKQITDLMDYVRLEWLPLHRTGFCLTSGSFGAWRPDTFTLPVIQEGGVRFGNVATVGTLTTGCKDCGEDGDS